MKYYSDFVDILNNRYTVTIEVDDDDTTEKEITLSDTPFTVEMDKSNGNIFKAAKYQSATVGVMTDGLDDYMFNCYSPKAQQVKVTLKKGDNIEWVGYVEPSLYSIGYEYKREELDIDCIDALSTLQYLKYKAIGDTKGIYSLKEYLIHILKKANAYTNLYIHRSTFISETDTRNIYDVIKVSEQIFFDKDGKSEDDDTYQDALEKIMTYMGHTMIAVGDDVYIIDYDALKANIYDFDRVTIADGTTVTVTLDNAPYNVVASSYSSDGQKLSLDKVYQKASVEDSFYTIDSLMNDLYDEDDLERIDDLYTDIPNTAYLQNSGGHYYTMYKVYRNKKYDFNYYNDSDVKEDISINMPIHTTMRYIPTYSGIDEYSTIYALENNYPELAPPMLLRYKGQCAALVYCHDYNSDDDDMSWKNIKDGTAIMPYFSYDKYLVLQVNQHDTSFTRTRKPLLSVNPQFSKPIALGAEDLYIVISGNCTFQDRWGRFGKLKDCSREDDSWTKDSAYISASLSYGGMWYSEASGWTTTETTFYIPINQTDKGHYLGQSLSVKNNIPYTWGIDKEGYAIPLPGSLFNNSTFTLTLYTPTSLNSSYLTQNVWIKDFDVTLHVKGEEYDEQKDTSGTTYYNEDNTIFSDIDVNNCEEMSSVKFKICTYDHKKVAYNTPIYINDDNTNKYVEDVYSKATGQTLIPEKQLIYKLVNQYAKPAKIIEVTYKDNIPLYKMVYDDCLDTTFMVDSVSKDYKLQNYKYKLIEKR